MKKVRLGDVCEIVSGSTPKTGIPEYWDGEYKWITPAELDEETYIINDSVRHISEFGIQKTGLKSFPEGTVILSSRAPIGKTAIAGCEMYCNQGFKNLICSSEIYNKYLYFFLSSKTEYLNSLGRGATFKEISKSIVENIEINLPSIDEQKSIAEQFEQLNELFKIKKCELKEIDELVKSRFIEMFGDPRENSNNYPVVALSDIAEYYNGLTYKPENVADEGTIVLRSSNIQKNQLDFNDVVRVDCAIRERLYVKENDILMCSRNGSAKLVGKVALIKNIEEPMTFGAFMMIIRSCYYSYLKTYFQLAAFRDQIKTGATTTINQITGKMLDCVKLPMPNKDDVEMFAAFVEQTDKLKLAVQETLNELETLKKSLMQKYFG